MFKLKNENVAIPVVLIAGILWSFGPLVVRYMDQPELVPWQYLFARGITIFILLNIYLFFEEGLDFLNNYKKIGLSGLIGGAGLGTAMISFIWSITHTSAAITLLCLAAMPFMTALLGFLFLKEIISTNVWVAIFTAAVGIVIMALGNFETGSLFGLIFWSYISIRFFYFFSHFKMEKRNSKIYNCCICRLFLCNCFIIYFDQH